MLVVLPCVVMCLLSLFLWRVVLVVCLVGLIASLVWLYYLVVLGLLVEFRLVTYWGFVLCLFAVVFGFVVFACCVVGVNSVVLF